MTIFKPEDQVFWYIQKSALKPLKHKIRKNIVVVGGGMAGLTVAQCFNNKKFSVALIEKNFCGSGASGKSSGFITPDSELSLYDFYRKFGADDAKKLWDFVCAGVEFIRKNIKNYLIDCDYVEQDTAVLANCNKSFEDDIKKDYEARLKLGYQSFLYDKLSVKSIIGSSEYYGAVQYKDTYGIKAFDYCQVMKKHLIEEGVEIYEDTPVIKINLNGVETPYASVDADYIILCADHYIAQLGKLIYEIYHAQTYLMLSDVLSEKEIKKIFPDKPIMVWDTDLIYQYYRITGDNRLMLGGASLLSTYSKFSIHNNSGMFKKLYNYFKDKFPQAKINFRYMWPGLIGISKDIIPIAGPDLKQSNIYYIAATAGLPWAAALGQYATEHIVEGRKDLDSFFSVGRDFFIGPILQKIIGTKLAFAISNFVSINK